MDVVSSKKILNILKGGLFWFQRPHIVQTTSGHAEGDALI
jgi:hypothetical protein